VIWRWLRARKWTRLWQTALIWAALVVAETGVEVFAFHHWARFERFAFLCLGVALGLWMARRQRAAFQAGMKFQRDRRRNDEQGNQGER
jgi:hypothetical protein